MKDVVLLRRRRRSVRKRGMIAPLRKRKSTLLRTTRTPLIVSSSGVSLRCANRAL